PGIERRILAATDGGLAEQGRLRQAGAGELLDQPPARIAMRGDGLERPLAPFPGLLPERYAGKRMNTLFVDTKLMEGHHPSRSDATRGRAEEGDGIGLVDQDVSADHRIEGLGIGEGLRRSLAKIDVSEPGRPGPFLGDGDGLRAAIDPDDRSGGVDQRAGEHRDTAVTTAQVEAPPARADPRAPQEPLGDGPEDGRLARQPPDLSPRMSKDVLHLGRATRSIRHVAPSQSSTPFAA